MIGQMQGLKVTVRMTITNRLDSLDYPLLVVTRGGVKSHLVLIYFTVRYTIQCSFFTATHPPPSETAIAKDSHTEKVIEMQSVG